MGFDIPDFVKLRDEGASTLDQEKRKVSYRKIQELVLDECFSMAVAGESTYWACQNYLTRQSRNQE